MRKNRGTLDRLFEEGGIDIRRGRIFETSPQGLARPVDWDRVRGMMLGLAIGDALGRGSEGKLPAARRARYGEIRHYLPNKHVGGRRVGTPSDDTQLAFWTLEQMIADRGFVPEHVAARFVRGQIFGIGRTVQDFVASYRSGQPWHKSGRKSAGNGALMRIAPMVIPHLRTATADLWVDTALSAMITHNDSASIAACVAFVDLLWRALQAEEAPQPGWWTAIYLHAAQQLERDENYRAGGEAFADYRGTLWEFIEEHVGPAYESELSVEEACNRWHSGAYLLETVPSALLILMRHGDDPEEAIVRAVNDTWDNDTIAAIVGAAVGALHGADALPRRWVDDLTGQVDGGDDGRAFELLEQARELWGSPEPGAAG
jgi:ADP-ribosyl-[dinitrogen reductase] hydrolase